MCLTGLDICAHSNKGNDNGLQVLETNICYRNTESQKFKFLLYYAIIY